MSTQILNLTPHEINIGTASIKPFGVVARVYVESISDGEFTTASGTTIPISHSYYGDVENLPNPMPNTIYIVSALVASRVPTRSDVFYPCCMVRDTPRPRHRLQNPLLCRRPRPRCCPLNDNMED